MLVVNTLFPISQILQEEILRQDTSIRKFARMKTNNVLTSSRCQLSRFNTSGPEFVRA